MKVLIVDDSFVVRDRISEMLSGITGIEIVGDAANYITAIYMVNKLKPDIVTLDIRIPVENGIEVLKKIKRSHPSTIVVMLTNFPHEQYRAKCFKHGANYFLSKSDEFEKLSNILIEICKQKFK